MVRVRPVISLIFLVKGKKCSPLSGQLDWRSWDGQQSFVRYFHILPVMELSSQNLGANLPTDSHLGWSERFSVQFFIFYFPLKRTSGAVWRD